MAKGDLLVLFSDGISEANNVDGEEFGDNGIIASVGRQAEDVEPAVVLTQLFADLHTFTGDELQGDDMTGLILRYDG